MKRISVIVAAYNVEKYISMCIESILAQDNVKEIIVVEDASSDRTAEICDVYATKFDIIKVIHQHHAGCSAARNVALDIANGEYIAFVDADDFIRPGMYKTLIDALEANDADIAICNFDDVSSDGTVIGTSDAMYDECLSGKEALHWVERPRFWAYSVVWNRIYKRKIFEGLRFPEGKIHEDEYIFHETFLRSTRIVCIKDSLYCYRINHDSIINTSFAVKRIDGFDAIFNRFNCYCELGYTELFRGTIERAKGMMWLIYKGKSLSPKDQARVKLVARNFKEMVHKTGREAGLLNHIIALSPRMYYRVRGIIKGR